MPKRDRDPIHEATDTPTLQGFVAWMEAGDTEIKRDLDQGGNQVRIMLFSVSCCPRTATMTENSGEILLPANAG